MTWFRSIFNAKNKDQPARVDQFPAAAPFGGLPDRSLRLLNRLSLNTGPLRLALPAGSRPSPLARTAIEFREHRQYAPGDDFRYVDWKASARQEHIFVKQGESQKATLVYVLVDCSASMAWSTPGGEAPKHLAALGLAQALGYLALADSDRLVIAPVTSGGQAASSPAASHLPVDDVPIHSGARNGLPYLGPLWGKGQAPLLSGYLRSLRFYGRLDLNRALVQLSQRKLSRGGLVLVISDMLGVRDVAPGMAALPAPLWRVAFCHLLHPAELQPELAGQYELRDIETGQRKRYQVTAQALVTYHERLQAWLEALSQSCRDNHALYSLLPTNGSLETDMLGQLIQAQVVRRQ